jgi:hypothetical protein
MSPGFLDGVAVGALIATVAFGLAALLWFGGRR